MTLVKSEIAFREQNLPPSMNVLGTTVACASYDSARESAKTLARQGRPTAICPANTHIIAEAKHDPAFGRIIGKFDLILPDGMPIVWTLNFYGARLPDRVYGPYLMQHVVKDTPRPWRHFLFGDTEDCLRDLRQAMQRLQPDVDIVGALSPPFRTWTEADEESFADTINAAQPDFVWVALPGVRMERWIIANQDRYKGGVFLAVGDAFTLLSGRRPFAPRWMQRLGLTWFYRLCLDPFRLGPRYLCYNSLFVFYIIQAALKSLLRRE